MKLLMRALKLIEFSILTVIVKVTLISKTIIVADLTQLSLVFERH